MIIGAKRIIHEPDDDGDDIDIIVDESLPAMGVCKNTHHINGYGARYPHIHNALCVDWTMVEVTVDPPQC